MKSIPLKDGEPRYIRVYDAGDEFVDRYTVVFGKKRVGEGPRSEFMHLGMGQDPRGFSAHGFSRDLIDRPGHSHLGKKLKFGELHDRCQQLVRSTHTALWAS